MEDTYRQIYFMGGKEKLMDELSIFSKEIG